MDSGKFCMPKSLTSWPKRHSRLGAPLHLTPRVKYGRSASNQEDNSAGTSCLKYHLRQFPRWAVENSACPSHRHPGLKTKGTETYRLDGVTTDSIRVVKKLLAKSSTQKGLGKPSVSFTGHWDLWSPRRPQNLFHKPSAIVRTRLNGNTAGRNMICRDRNKGAIID